MGSRFGCVLNDPMTDKSHSSQNSGAATAVAPDKSIEFVLKHAATPEQFCTALAKLFAVRTSEVALMRADNGLLKFVIPEQLKTAGSIPISSSSSVAAHTAASKKTQLFNNFAKVKHARVFETVKITTEGQDQSEQAAIQKIMSVPVLRSDNKVIGVIQVSRKAFDLAAAGPDFTPEDLQQLELAAKVACKMPFLDQKSSRK